MQLQAAREKFLCRIAFNKTEEWLLKQVIKERSKVTPVTAENAGVNFGPPFFGFILKKLIF